MNVLTERIKKSIKLFSILLAVFFIVGFGLFVNQIDQELTLNYIITLILAFLLLYLIFIIIWALVIILVYKAYLSSKVLRIVIVLFSISLLLIVAYLFLNNSIILIFEFFGYDYSYDDVSLFLRFSSIITSVSVPIYISYWTINNNNKNVYKQNRLLNKPIMEITSSRITEDKIKKQLRFLGIINFSKLKNKDINEKPNKKDIFIRNSSSRIISDVIIECKQLIISDSNVILYEDLANLKITTPKFDIILNQNDVIILHIYFYSKIIFSDINLREYCETFDDKLITLKLIINVQISDIENECYSRDLVIEFNYDINEDYLRYNNSGITQVTKQIYHLKK
jgi:hypothetical protein